MTADDMAQLIADEARRLAEEISAQQAGVRTSALTIGFDVEAMGDVIGRALAGAIERLGAASAAAIVEERATRSAQMGALTERLTAAIETIPAPADLSGVERHMAELAAAARDMAAPVDVAPIADAIAASGKVLSDAINTAALALIEGQKSAAELMRVALDRNTEAQLRDRDLKFDAAGKIIGTKVA